jgi:hypothetical protein
MPDSLVNVKWNVNDENQCAARILPVEVGDPFATVPFK